MQVNCEVCGTSFKKRLRDVKRTAHNYCSNKCRGIGMLNNGGRNTNESRVLTNCDNCGKGIIRYNPKGARVFCSSECDYKKGYTGEISGAYFSSVRNGAKSRDMVFDITKEDIWEQFLKQERRCALTDIELFWQDGFKGDRGTASVDRKDSEIGYTKENIQIVHKDVNRMKSNFDEAYFIEMCGKIFNKANK